MNCDVENSSKPSNFSTATTSQKNPPSHLLISRCHHSGVACPAVAALSPEEGVCSRLGTAAAWMSAGHCLNPLEFHQMGELRDSLRSGDFVLVFVLFSDFSCHCGELRFIRNQFFLMESC